MPEDLGRAARRSQADPQDPEARLEDRHARARIEGPEIFLEALLDRQVWNQSHEAVQDAAISEVDRRLGPAFEHLHIRTYTCQDLSHRLASFRHVKTGAEMILIPGGTYPMGGDGHSDEQPVHACRITRPLLIGRLPLLQAEWDRPGLGIEDTRKRKDLALPIEGVSWNDAQVWLEQVGDGLRLPSEAEWEYACRAGTTTEYFWGDDTDPSFCCFRDNSGGRTHAPQEHDDKANAFGLVDMSGNVFEWCQDNGSENYQDGPDNQLSRGVGSNWDRLYWGGGRDDYAEDCRSACRVRDRPGRRGDDIGLRLSRGIA